MGSNPRILHLRAKICLILRSTREICAQTYNVTVGAGNTNYADEQYMAKTISAHLPALDARDPFALRVSATRYYDLVLVVLQYSE